jgi:hypothetical protein
MGSPDTRSVRLMELAETALVIDYFYSASAEYLNSLGVDPALLHISPGSTRCRPTNGRRCSCCGS